MEICSSKEDAMEGIVEIASNFEDSLRDNYYTDAYDEPTLAVKKVELAYSWLRNKKFFKDL